MFNPSRDEVRNFFTATWQKHLNQELTSPMEGVALDWMLEHPEYHALLASGPEALSQDYTPDSGESNPFLHLAMHLTISEQSSIDQPPGIRAALEALVQRLDSSHKAHHQVMECLGEMLWTSQRNGLPPDGEQYVDCVRRRLK